MKYIILFMLCFWCRIASSDDSWKNFYGIAWSPETPTESINYAKQMGYDYIALKSTIGNKNFYAANPNRAGLKFYLIDPEQLQSLVPTITTTTIDTTKPYTQAQIDYIERYFAWKSTDAFPVNMATGWFSSATKFSIVWDLQQQAVIDYLVGQIISVARSYEDANLPFTFAGYMVDVPRLSGDFNIYDANKSNYNTGVSISYWTGSDSSLVHGAITHEYATQSEGRAAYYKQLNTRLKQEWPDSKWMSEPYELYSATGKDEWIYQVKDRFDKDELTFDMLFQEGSGTDFVDDTNNFNSGVNITKNRVGITQPNSVGEIENRLYAAKAGINGAWYNWFGRFGGTGDMPAFTTIAEVYPRLKFVRCIPNWDNLNKIPLVNRSWNGSTTDPIYNSYDYNNNQQSHIDGNVMYSRHPKTRKIFAVFCSVNGEINLKSNEVVVSARYADSYFYENGDAIADFNLNTNGLVRLKNRVPIDTDPLGGQIKGNAYIFTTINTNSRMDVVYHYRSVATINYSVGKTAISY